MSDATRSLTFSDGSSNKFWTIVLSGTEHTVTFGKVGTNGQTQNKSFESDDAAKKAYDKLVAEKMKKGYVDVAGAGAASPVAAKESAKPPRKSVPSGAAASPTGAPQPTNSSKVQTATTVANPIELSFTGSIDLAPEDWHRAAYRTRRIMERGTPRPFDMDACVQKLAKLKTATYGWDINDWEDLNLPAALSREEAHFWLMAISRWPGRGTTTKQFAETMSKQEITGRVTVEMAGEIAYGTLRQFSPVGALCLSNLLTAEEFLELLLVKPTVTRQAYLHDSVLASLLNGYSRYVLPYLTESEITAARTQLRKAWDPNHDPAIVNDHLPPEFFIAAAVGLPDLVYEVTSRWDDKRFTTNEWLDNLQRPQDLVLGLASREIIASEWRRLKLRMRSGDQVRAFLACTEDTALDCIVNSVLLETNKEKCEELLKAFVLVRTPRAAEGMLQCKLGAKTPSLARDWLDRNVGCAVAGLIKVAGGKGKLAEAALDYLRGVKLKGHSDLIAKALQNAGSSESTARVQAAVLDYEERIYEPLDANSTPAWLTEAIQATHVKRKLLPGWATAAVLPPLIVGDRRLSDEQTELVLQLLAATPATEKHPLLTAIRNRIPKASRDEFVWKMFQTWQEDGFPSKEKWAMGAIGHLGDDGCVLKLTPLIRVWPGESQHARAVFGLECLRAIGSSVALMQLSGIAQKLKFKGLKTKAELFVTEIAKERGLTRDELEDRVVPDCGLDENGRRTFSFGTRSFSFVLGGDLKPMIRDESGKIRPNLPDPGAKDDAAIAAESVAEWKLLKKQIKEVATIQAGRLEQAMITGRRWSTEDFGALLVRHPLMTHLVQKLIWGGFDKQGDRVATFRVTEERDYADADDNIATLKDAEMVGVVHSLELTEQERKRWGEVLGDYEVVSPFLQLGRPAFLLEPGEETQTDIQRFNGLKIVAPTLVFGLEKMNWIRGVGLDGGGFDEHSKQFPSAQITAVVTYEGNVGMGWISPDELLELKGVYFCQGMRAPSGYGGWNYSTQGGEPRMALKDVPVIVISEVLADMQVLKSKAK